MLNQKDGANIGTTIREFYGSYRLHYHNPVPEQKASLYKLKNKREIRPSKQKTVILTNAALLLHLTKKNMPLILPVKGIKPHLGNNCFVAENATIAGDVVLGDDCTVWFNAVIRGDVNTIRIGNKTNIQDGAVIHCSYQKAATTVGNNVSIGHNAIVHGCTVEDNVLIGMGAIVMDKAVVQKNTIVAAGAIVLENTVCESGYIYAGIPAKKVKQLSPEQIEGLDKVANNYVMYGSWFTDSE